MGERGRYVVIEGADGTGKSEQVARLARRLGTMGIKSLEVHEPDGADGVRGATELRKIIKDGTIPRDAWTNVLLFTAARRLNWLQAMRPALQNGNWVLAARSWISTVAYQGYGEGIDVGRIRDRTLQDVGEAYLHPDLELILALKSEEVRKSRIAGRGQLETPDTFESMPDGFQAQMQDGYVRFALENDVELLPADGTPDEVEADIWARVQRLL